MFKDKTIVYTSGTFDMFHYNHLRMINYARSLADILIVGVSTDELVSSYKAKPIIPFTERLQIIEALKTPDIVIPQHTLDHSEIVKKLNIDAFVVGDDWYGKYDYLKDLGVQVFYFPYGTGVSSSNLKKTIHDSYEANLKSQRQSKPESVKGFGEKNKGDDGKRVLITGGTKGIGRAVAECLAKAGYSLILTYASDKEEALRVADGLLQQYKVEVLTLQADISDRKSIKKIESFLTGCSMRLDAVIFNAGLTCRDSFEDLDIVEWERVFFANVHFPVFLLQRIVGLINKGGSIVFTGSLMGIQPHSVSLVYGVTKSAVHALVKNMVKFLVPYELRVNAVAPGFVDTEWQKTKPAEIRRNIENKVSLGRFCDPEELAEVYRMLVENSYFNGEVIVVDGGYSYK